MKRFGVIAIAALLAIGTGWAQTAAPPAPASVAAPAAKHKRLVDIEAELNLTPTQKPLWDAFIGTIRSAGKARHDALLQSRAAPKDLPSRLVQQEKMYALQQKTVLTEQQALMPLWAQLDDQQKSVLNDELMVSKPRAAKKKKAKPAAP